MILRDFRNEDSETIVTWIRSEEELYRWSSDRYNKFPLTGDDINRNYEPQLKTHRFFPLTGVDENGNVIGHLIIRYPNEDDDSSVRFGFVIVDPKLRGKGYGKELLKLAIKYVKEHLTAKRIDLGVFVNNDNARYCYEAAGFKAFDTIQMEVPAGIWDCIFLEMFIDRSPEPSVEKAEDGDIDTLVKMRLAYLEEDKGDLDDKDVEIIQEKLPDYFRKHLNHDLFAYVIRDEGEIAACAFLLVVEKPFSPAFITGKTGTVLNVLTKKDFRLRGYARLLMDTLISDAKAMDLSLVELQATEDGYGLYRSLGFKDEISKYHPMKLTLK